MTTTGIGPEELGDAIVAVRVTNPGEFPAAAPQATEEAKPENYAAVAYPLVAATPAQILQQSPLRETALISLTVPPEATSIETGVSNITNPPALSVLVSAFLPAGDYTINWTVALGGTTGVPEINNFTFNQGATVIETSINGSGSGSSFAQTPFRIIVPTGGATYSINVGTTTPTVGGVYRADFVAIPDTNVGANVRICHSLNAAQDVARNGTNSTQGMPVTAPCAPFSVDATGPLWAVLESGGVVTVGVLSQERQR